MSAQTIGILFEEKVHKQLLKTGQHIYREADIRKEYPNITAIDHMIIFDNVCICIQDKYQQSKNTND